MVNTAVKFGLGAALIGLLIYGIKKASDYANAFDLTVVKYGIPQISNYVIYLPIQVHVKNPTSIPINIDRVLADVYLLNANQYQKVGQVAQPLSVPPGESDQLIHAAVDLKSIFKGDIIRTIAFIAANKNVTIRTNITATYAGFSIPVQTITNVIDLRTLGVSTVSGLGLTASHTRKIKNGIEYNKFFNLKKVQGNEVRLKKDGSVYDTLKLMEKLATETKSETKFIAEKLKGSCLSESLNNLWDFLYWNVQYKKDNPLREQLRTPVRTWKDRATGVDCDCYSIFIASVLKNWRVPYAFRMAAYSGDFQHVYVVVPIGNRPMKNKADYYVIDPVTDRFNYEVPFTKKHDYGNNNA